MKYVYNKLVRDKIVENINSQEGKKANFRVLNDGEYIEELNKKLLEETHEFIEQNEEEELADIMEVLENITRIKEINWDNVRKIQEEKKNEKGGFLEKIYLECVEEEKRNSQEEQELNKPWRKNN